MPKYKGGLGFRDIEIFNLSLLARQVWRILEEPASLSARVLKARYYPDTHVLQAVPGSHPSQIWRALIEGRDMLKLGLVKRIGDGKSTHIWDDNWIPRNFKLRPVCPRSLNPPRLVSELISEATRCWNAAQLEEHLLPMDVEVIQNIPISHVQQEDFYAWHYDKSGRFSVRSAYRMIMEIKKRRETTWRGVPRARILMN